MSYIHNIEIENFKSIRHQIIDGCKRINVFIGYPNVGKSNILEALSLFSIKSLEDDFNSFIRLADLTTIFFNGNVLEKAKIYVNNKHRLVIEADKDELSFIQQFEREGTSFEKADTGHMFLDDSADVFQKRHFRFSTKSNKINSFSSASIGKDNELPEIKKYDFRKNIQYNGEDYYTLSTPHGNNFFRILSSHENIRKEVAALFKPYHLELLYDARLQIFTILKRTESGIFSIPYELIADTLQRIIFYKTAILSNKNAVLLFEEPEAHMFPPYIKKLTTDILFDDNKNQYFIATHSPHILSELIEENQADLSIYIVDYVNGETAIKKLTDTEIIEIAQYGIDLFFNPESYLNRYGQPHSA